MNMALDQNWKYQYKLYSFNTDKQIQKLYRHTQDILVGMYVYTFAYFLSLSLREPRTKTPQQQ